MQIHNNTLIVECSAYDFKEMLERKKVKSWLKSVSAFANTEASSFFTTFYNLNWGKNERIPVEEVAERVAHLDFWSFCLCLLSLEDYRRCHLIWIIWWWIQGFGHPR